MLFFIDQDPSFTVPINMDDPVTVEDESYADDEDSSEDSATVTV